MGRVRSAVVAPILLPLLLLLLLLVPSVAALGLPSVHLTSGTIVGFSWEGVNSFKGVPYAQPPVGQLRWKPPLPWSGPRLALEWQKGCMQFTGGLSPKAGVSEDCLYVNVWSPDKGAGRPVMFFIHGGGWEGGSPEGYDGAKLARAYGVVVVTVAYRLGPFGFMFEPHLLALEPRLSALGLADQQAALLWVQANIAAFGGDPARVTIFGQSAGAGSVGTLLTMPSSSGLFRSAISESGVFFFANLTDMLPQGVAFAHALNCSSAPDPAACLLLQPAEAILTALPWNGNILLGFRDASLGAVWWPAIDGDFIVDQPLVAALDGHVYAERLLIGSNANEGALFVLPLFSYSQISADRFEYYVNVTWGTDFLGSTLLTYSADVAAGNYLGALVDMVGDFWFQCQRLLFAEAAAAANVTTYTYLFSYDFVDPGQPNLGAVHGDEVDFVWDGIWFKLNSSQEQLAGWMSSAWAAFASADDPNAAAPSLPLHWPQFAQTDQPFEWTLPPSVLPAPYRAQFCAMWEPTLRTGVWTPPSSPLSHS